MQTRVQVNIQTFQIRLFEIVDIVANSCPGSNSCYGNACGSAACSDLNCPAVTAQVTLLDAVLPAPYVLILLILYTLSNPQISCVAANSLWQPSNLPCLGISPPCDLLPIFSDSRKPNLPSFK